MHFTINPLDQRLSPAIIRTIDEKTKPVGALGLLESVAHRVALVQQSLAPQLIAPHLVVFAADHGITAEGVSKYPAEVTYQMMLNFLGGGAAINVFCRQYGINLRVVDAGVQGDFAEHPDLIRHKIAPGTKNFAHEPAMSLAQYQEAIEKGAAVVQQIAAGGCNVIGFGEMGIGNTSAAAVIMHKITGLPIHDCVGRGTGLADAALQHKRRVLSEAVAQYPACRTPAEIMTTFGGFEMVQMCGAMLQAAELKMLVLIDGFIATAVLLAAYALMPPLLDYCLFCHQSDEQGHQKMLDYLGVTPILRLHMRLGEGTGCALAYPLIESAVRFFNQMASFESAGVTQNEPA